MKIEKISSQSTFNARVSQKFVKNAETFYLNRNLPIEFAEKLMFFSQILGNGFKTVYVLSRT